MTRSATRPGIRAAVAAIAAALLVGIGTMAGPAAPATAHDQVSEQTPSAGEHLAAAPDAVRLRFATRPLGIGLTILVADADGLDWAFGEPVVEGDTVVQLLDPTMPDGNYQVRWRVVSADGHPISESFMFSVGDVVAAPAPAPTSAGEPVAAIDDQGADASAVADGGSAAQHTVVVAAIGAAAGVLVFAVGALLLGRRRHPQRDAGTPQQRG